MTDLFGRLMIDIDGKNLSNDLGIEKNEDNFY